MTEEQDEPEITAESLSAAALEKLRMHYRREWNGLRVMLDEGQLDFIDALAAAPALIAEGERQREIDEYERRRLAKLENYTPDWERIAREDAGEMDRVR